MTHDEFLRAFERIVEAPDSSLNGSEALESFDGWDSLAMVSLMTVVAEHCEVHLSPRGVARCNTVDDVFALTEAA